MNSNSPSEKKEEVDLERRRALKIWAGLGVAALAGTIYTWSATAKEQEILDTDVNKLIVDLEGFNENVSKNMKQPDILAPSIVKGMTLAADAAFYYSILHSRLSPQERTKLIIAITAAHGFLAAVGTIIPALGNDSQYKKAIILCCSALAVGYVMSEQYDKEEGEEREEGEEKEGMLKTISEKNILALTFSAWVLSVSFDALYSSFGKYGSMNDRGLDMNSIVMSNVIITVTILVCMWLLKEGLELTEGNFWERLNKSIGPAMSQVKDMPHFKKMSSYFPEDSDGWEDFTMDAVMTLILSFGVRGIMGITEYQWHEIPFTGTTVDALGVSAAVMVLLKKTWTGQMAAWKAAHARKAVEGIFKSTTT
jgi:hypothetical protein